MSKAQQMRNWDMDRLPSAMLDHAAADAFVALDLLTAILGMRISIDSSKCGSSKVILP